MKKGMIVLMGSGELTSTMVEVHKEVIGKIGGKKKALFLDTPAGFQLNADELSQRAGEYFRKHVQHPLSTVSFKSKDIPPYAAEQSFRLLRESDYVLVGPGSPTYAVRQWLGSPIPELLAERIKKGACFIAASAAALTVGRFTMPVYEIYKVGQEVHWVEGMDILGRFGFNLVVIPHWNNAEGGTHDTRCCFIGEQRFRSLESLLPPDVGIIGLDEHTACILDLERNEGEIRGIGTVTVRHGSAQRIFSKGEGFSLDLLRGQGMEETSARQGIEASVQEETEISGEGTFWVNVHRIEDTFHQNINDEPEKATNAILELDRTIWQAQQDMENVEFITQAREILRELIVLMGTRLASLPKSREDCLSPLVQELLKLREQFRHNKLWKEADAVRDCLMRANIAVEDRDTGSRWRLGP
jgi:peptidase E